MHMSCTDPLRRHMLQTLTAVVIDAERIILAILLSRHNRDIAAYALEGDCRSRCVEPSGAGAELAGLFAVALISMTLLSFGYRSHSGTADSEVAQRNNQLSTERTDP